MRRANKILMAAVAILLCLVLITTSVVSGVFAKYAIKKQASTSVGLEKFGVTITMSVPDATNLGTYGGATVNTEVMDGDSGTISITGLKMYPGCQYPRAAKFEFSGTPSVDVQLKIIPTITYSDAMHTSANYRVPTGAKINLGSSTTYYMPLGFTFCSNSTSIYKVVDPWMSSTTKANVSATAVSNAIASGIVTGTNKRLKGSSAEPLEGQDEFSVSGNTLTIGIFKAGTPITFDINSSKDLTCFCMGFYYPLDWPSETSTDRAKYDKISTYFSRHAASDATITINYKVELVQVS